MFEHRCLLLQDVPSENSETDRLLDEEDGDKEEEESNRVDVEVPFVLLLTRPGQCHL